jgi:DNA polymerase III sliding clamp (beta) subunit (PCNA family)
VTVAPATSPDQARPILTGVHLEPGEEEGTITAVATDSYRMAWQTVKANNLPLSQHNPNKGKPITLLIPAAKAKLAAATVPQVIAADDRYVFFGTTQAVTFVRLIDGAFPKWRSLVKDEKATGTWEVMGADLVSTLKTAPKDLDKIPVFIDFLQRELRLVHNGETAWSAPIPGTVSHKLTDTVIALNLPYFADSVKVCGEANLTIEIVDAMKPITITGVNGAKYLQMPVRI